LRSRDQARFRALIIRKRGLRLSASVLPRESVRENKPLDQRRRRFLRFRIELVASPFAHGFYTNMRRASGAFVFGRQAIRLASRLWGDPIVWRVFSLGNDSRSRRDVAIACRSDSSASLHRSLACRSSARIRAISESLREFTQHYRAAWCQRLPVEPASPRQAAFAFRIATFAIASASCALASRSCASCTIDS
jgi:hypothetical protein